MNYLKTVALSTVIMGAAGISHAATVDFTGFAEGTVLGANTDLGGGIVADVSAGDTNSQGAVIFDTNAGTVSTSNDGDLTSPFTNTEDSGDARSFGNAVIVQEDQSSQGSPTMGPDDLGSGGFLTFDFATDVVFNSLHLLDSQEGSVAELFLGGVSVLSFTLDATNESDTGNNPNDNLFTFLDFGGAIGDSLTVTFAASGAIGEFDATSVAPVPLPASLPLLVGGFGLMAFIRRRRKAA